MPNGWMSEIPEEMVPSAPFDGPSTLETNREVGRDRLIRWMDLSRRALHAVWGYDSFRPLQEKAIENVFLGRDSLTILPTGGGKSIIFQLPITVMEGMAVVISPLIALMQDQVRALQLLGIPTACFTSLQSEQEIRRDKARMFRGELKLVYISPERLLMEHVIEELAGLNICYFAIDEAHCISQWGHDFRPEYTRLGELRRYFPNTPCHAFTATAPPRIQGEICQQLRFTDPSVHQGSYFRSNLFYRVKMRGSIKPQLLKEIRQFQDEDLGIVYCLTRKETETMSAFLNQEGISALPYHAGLAAEVRRKNQDAFAKESIRVMVATVAFGMGIDQSNIRFVIHLGMPKSLSHYQQESGRAGRDGLRSHCTLFYGARDMAFWKRILAEEGNQEVQSYHLDCMIQYASRFECRHRQLLAHFGQELEPEKCGMCDVCTGEIESLTNSKELASKILSTVFRVRQSFGAHYVAQVLTGSREQKLLDNGHDRLSVYGMMKSESQSQVLDWVNQLVSQKYLVRQDLRFPVLRLTRKGFGLLNPKKAGMDQAELDVFLVKTQKPKKAKKREFPLMKGDPGLTQALRALRLRLSQEMNVPAFMIFGDRSLHDLAAKEPKNEQELLDVFGIGKHKVKKLGAQILEVIRDFNASDV